MSENNQTDTRTAIQRLNDLEHNVSNAFATMDMITRDLGLMKNAVKLLDNKVNAIVKAASSGTQINDAEIDRIMVENNVEDLANKVKNMVAQGIVSPEDTVSDNSFIVGKEADAEGNVTNPRVQFALKALSPDVQPKFLGAKVGDVLTLLDGKLVFTLLESYKINGVPTPEEQPETPQTPETPDAASNTSQDPNASNAPSAN